jgi:hypothetical protein
MVLLKVMIVSITDALAPVPNKRAMAIKSITRFIPKKYWFFITIYDALTL